MSLPEAAEPEAASAIESSATLLQRVPSQLPAAAAPAPAPPLGLEPDPFAEIPLDDGFPEIDQGISDCFRCRDHGLTDGLNGLTKCFKYCIKEP